MSNTGDKMPRTVMEIISSRIFMVSSLISNLSYIFL
jgi:hypothetical protein